VVNIDNATSEDLCTLIKDVQARVKETSNVTIEPEVILAGEF
jgi:UDP-N-acetylenolpyruvoylglucosamine reductase